MYNYVEFLVAVISVSFKPINCFGTIFIVLWGTKHCTLSEKKYKSCHWGSTFSKCTLLYLLGTNMYTLGTNMDPLGFWNGTAPVAAFELPRLQSVF